MPDVAKGRTVAFALDPSELHLFDQGGRSLFHARGGGEAPAQ
jgi:hypothetical protein